MSYSIKILDSESVIRHFVKIWWIESEAVKRAKDVSIARVTAQDLKHVKLDPSIERFQFFDIAVTYAEIDGEKVRLASKPFKFSSVYFYGGKVLSRQSSLARARREGSDIILNWLKADPKRALIIMRNGETRIFRPESIWLKLY